VKVIEQGFEQKILKEDETAYELLGNSWILAREAEKAEPSIRRRPSSRRRARSTCGSARCCCSRKTTTARRRR
jgi:hypothetical protein